MSEPTTRHHYRVRQEPGGVRVRAAVDLATETITFHLPDGTRGSVDVVTARALYMVMSGAVYRSLTPSGPLLRLERDTGEGWRSDRP